MLIYVFKETAISAMYSMHYKSRVLVGVFAVFHITSKAA